MHLGVQPAAATEPVVPIPVCVQGLPVLIVDDNAMNRRLLTELLTHWHMQPLAVASGAAALSALEQAQKAGEPFQLVLVDAMMPAMDGFALVEQIKAQSVLVGVTIMMLSSGGQRGDALRCQEVGIAAYLPKPVMPWELWHTIQALLNPVSPPVKAPTLVTRHTLAEHRRPLHILLAEDNVVNQRLAVRLIEKLGHTVVIAFHGGAALAALTQHAFDLILMDVQMPIMGGLEATAAVRAQEQTTGGHLPIIAMTAHATDGDRDICLAAGMDDYVTKPLQVDDLYMAVARIQTGQPKPFTALVEPPLALSTALAHVDGDKALLAEVVESFLRNYPQQIMELREALRTRDAQGIQRVADNLKDMVALLGAKQAYTLARTLETLGKEARLEDASNVLDRLELILDHITTAFAKPDWLEALS